MTVDPADSSYMPSLVVVSGTRALAPRALRQRMEPPGLMLRLPLPLPGGNSLNNLIELKTINISPTDTTVSLLSDCTEVSGSRARLHARVSSPWWEVAWRPAGSRPVCHSHL